jgi:hypothetical protein
MKQNAQSFSARCVPPTTEICFNFSMDFHAVG